MPIYEQDLQDRRYGTGGFAIDDKYLPSSFPSARWAYQSQKYLDYWNFFTGEVWNEVIPNKLDANRQPVLRYPLQINYIATAAKKHNYVLWGEVPEGPETLCPVRIVPRTSDKSVPPTEENKTHALELEQFINQVWSDNNGNVLKHEGGLISQFLGGMVYKVSYSPDALDLEHEIKIEYVLPDFFLPVWETSNPDNLLEAFVVWRMPAREAALRFGVQVSSESGSPLYIEHWTKDEINITLNGKPITYQFDNGESITYDHAENPYGFVPFVYIPNQRAGSYYGMSIVDDLKELSREMNARLADFGDAIREGAHRDIYLINTNQIKVREIPGAIRDVIDLGGTNPVNGESPDIKTVEPPKISDNLFQYPEMLRMQFGHDSGVPPVAEGDNQASQRSALTLAFLMWPLTSVTRSKRVYWENGLVRFAKMIARVAMIKGIGGITEAHLKNMNWSIDWPVMIPRDREQLVNEVILATQANLISPQTAIERLGFASDPNEEYERIQEHMEWVSQLQAAQDAGINGSADEPQAETGLESEKA